MKFGKWSLALFSLFLLGIFIINYIIPILALGPPTGTNEINVSLITPANGGYSNTANVNFTYNVSWNQATANVTNCTLVGNFTGSWAANTTNSTALVNNAYNGINISLSDGSYLWNIYCYNVTGGTGANGTDNRTVTVDTSKPTWYENATSPSSGVSYSSGASYQFNITWNDTTSSISEVFFEWNGSTNETYSGGSGNIGKDGDVYYITKIDLAVGTYTYKWYANDSADNWNTSDTWSFTISQAGPNPVYLYLNGNLNQNLTIPYSQSNATGVATGGSVSIYRDGVNVTSTENNQLMTLAAKPAGYAYMVNATGNQNYTDNSTGVTYYLKINKATTNVTLYLNGTRGNRSYLPNATANFTVVLNVSGKNVNLTYNLTGLVEITNTTPFTNITKLPSTLGSYNITGYYEGDANYSSDSETWFATVATTTTTTTTTSATTTTGGGGGTPVKKTPKKVKTWTKLTPGKVEIMKINNPDIGLKQISITVMNPAQTVTITVTKLEGKPASVVHTVSGKVYKYIEIKARNLEDENLDEGKIQFSVNKSWILENKIDKATIALNRYHDNKWNKLLTKKVYEDNNYVYYEAETTGFSTFAVTGEEIVKTTISTTVAPTTTTVPPTTTVAAEAPLEVIERPSWLMPLIIAVIIILTVIFVWDLRLTRKRKQRKKQKLWIME